jgi:formylglycine-generating enzyme required for sulfatase activity
VSVVAAPAFAAEAPAAAAPAAAGKPYAQEVPKTLAKIDMVPIPGGELKRADGSAVPIKPLFVSKTEITWDTFDVFCYQLDMTDKEKAAGVDAKSRPSRPYGAPDHGFGHAGYPAIHITRFAAEQFCEWLNKQAGNGKKYRLPTDAEWEYACRAGEMTTPPAGDASGATGLDAVAWFWDNSEDKTHPAGKKSPNAWGLYDMLGNAAEYVTIPGEDPKAKPTAMGGSYDSEAKDVHCGAKKTQTPEWNSTDPQNPKSKWWLSDGPFVGFRIVCEQ